MTRLSQSPKSLVKVQPSPKSPRVKLKRGSPSLDCIQSDHQNLDRTMMGSTRLGFANGSKTEIKTLLVDEDSTKKAVGKSNAFRF